MKRVAGEYRNQRAGYKSFCPYKLPPNPPIDYDNQLRYLLSEADWQIGRLDGITEILPNPDLFVAMYTRKEALLSSQIEGTQASLMDVFDYESGSIRNNLDINEVVNYINAMNYGLSRLETLPISLRLIKEIHAKLLQSGRGSNMTPGEFRKSQNWIGPIGSTISTASYIPPSVVDMNESMFDLEEYFYSKERVPFLIKVALIHAQFETIHPFLDGNGRTGRLLITFLLCQQKILTKPLLYLSYYFKERRDEYYDRLMAIRKDGDWEGWLKFFLSGVAYVAEEAITTAKQIIELREKITKILSSSSISTKYIKLVDYLFENPIVQITEIQKELKISHQSASRMVKVLEELSIVEDISPNRIRKKRHLFTEYFGILKKGT